MVILGASGRIFDIQRFSIHDGPGIRTTVFLKGCPLRCLWCHNPEGISPEPELMFFEYKCLGCGTCFRACPVGALTPSSAGEKNVPRLDRERCTGCGQCAEACPGEAWRLVGRMISVEELLTFLERDRLLYERSGGGATFSGGEPLDQPDFLRAALWECRRLGIPTALDTSGFAPPETFREIAPLVDLFLYDLKLLDPVEHQRFAGVPNTWILRNLLWLVESGRGKDVIVRIPVVPTLTDTEHNLRALSRFLADLQGHGGVREIHLLPYHDVAEKYARLGKPYPMPPLAGPSGAALSALRERLASAGLCVR